MKKYLIQPHPHVCINLVLHQKYVLVSTKSSCHVKQPIPPSLHLHLRKPYKNKSSKHFCSHTFKLKLMSTRAIKASGTFICAKFTNSSPLLHMDIPCFSLTQSLDPSLKYQSRDNLGSNPGKHMHSKLTPLYGSQ